MRPLFPGGSIASRSFSLALHRCKTTDGMEEIEDESSDVGI